MDKRTRAQAKALVDTTLDELHCYPEAEVVQLARTMLIARLKKQGKPRETEC